MADTISSLKAEIARLRAVCDEFDVDPDWAPKPPLYWVVTEREKADHDARAAAGRLVSATIDVKLRSARPRLIENLTRNNALLRRLQHG